MKKFIWLMIVTIVLIAACDAWITRHGAGVSVGSTNTKIYT